MPAPARILITAFRPFQGRSSNGSATLLRWLRSRYPRRTFVSSILPVDWVQAPLQLRRLLAWHRPSAVLSMGEGHPGRVAWECRAVNFQHGTDETGRTRAPSVIDQDAAGVLRTRLPHPSVSASLPASNPLVISEDAGTFLCNRLLWEALRITRGRAGFLHLPPQDPQPDASYCLALGSFLEDLLLEFCSVSPLRV